MARGIFYHPPILNNYLTTAPLAFLHLSTGLKNSGHSIELVDGRVERAPIEALLAKLPGADALLLSIMPGSQVRTALEACAEVRQLYPHIPIIAGGALASVNAESVIRSDKIDIAVKGRGEHILPHVLDNLEDPAALKGIPNTYTKNESGEIQRGPCQNDNAASALAPQFDEFLSSVAPYLMETRRSRRMIDYISSFGCPFKCNFCSETVTSNARWSALPAEELVNELIHMRDTWGIDGVLFQDALFITDRKRLDEFCDALLARDAGLNWICTARLSDIWQLHERGRLRTMQKTGCEMLFMGAEAGSDQTLHLYEKGIRASETYDLAKLLWEEYSILPHFSYVISYPVEDLEAVRRTLDLHARISDLVGAPSGEMGYYNPVQGTSFLAQHRHLYHVPEVLDGWADFDFSSQRLYRNPSALLEREVFRHQVKLRRRFPGVPWHFSYDIWQKSNFYREPKPEFIASGQLVD